MEVGKLFCLLLNAGDGKFMLIMFCMFGRVNSVMCLNGSYIYGALVIITMDIGYNIIAKKYFVIILILFAHGNVFDIQAKYNTVSNILYPCVVFNIEKSIF